MSKDLIEVSDTEAQDFFLSNASYSNINLPNYFDFNRVLKNINDFFKEDEKKEVKDSFTKEKPKQVENINHKIYLYKSKNTLRPISLLNPIIYVQLVRILTEYNNWKVITERFRDFRKVNKITCASTLTYSKRNFTGLKINNWIEKVEKKTVELSLKYRYIFNTDISNCYPSIYTHSIEWALHGKKQSKEKSKENKKSLGAKIDRYIRDFQHGQTNGIPQGSFLMDFIAEMVLGYTDTILEKKLKELEESKKLDEDYEIIRYRDDYRILVNKQFNGQIILNALTSVLLEFGMNLKEEKTDNYDIRNLILANPVKKAKLDYKMKGNIGENLYDKLLVLHHLVQKHPCVKTLATPLSIINKTYKKSNLKNKDVKLCIALLLDICIINPHLLDLNISIISQLIIELKKDEQIKVVDNILEKFNSMPEIGFLEIWLQRLSYPFYKEKEYKEKLCEVVTKVVTGPSVNIWNLEWIDEESKIFKIISDESIINIEKLEKIKLPFSKSETDPFVY